MYVVIRHTDGECWSFNSLPEAKVLLAELTTARIMGLLMVTGYATILSN